MLPVVLEKCRFWDDARGNVALAFGLALIPIVGAAGTALDYQAASNVRAQLQTEADAAALEVMKAAAEIQTNSANLLKLPWERSAMIEQKAATIIAARQEMARSRAPNRASGVTMSGRWEDLLKTEYTLTASGSVKRYFTLAGIGGSEPNMPVKFSASAKMEVQTSMSTSVPQLANPGYEAGDYNRIYAYCYDDTKKNETSKGRSKMTPISSNGTSGSYVELTSGAAFQNVQMPVCEGNEVLSWRLYNVRGQRTNSNAWPRDTWNSTTKLWSQTDRSGYEIYNHYSDTKLNGNSGLEDYAFRGDAFGYNSPIKMMETVVCDTMDQCTPGKPGSIIPSGKSRSPNPQNNSCQPGKFMYMGWEDRPFLKRNLGLNDFSANNSLQWTDSDYDDITLVISCPEKKITQYTAKVRLSK
jgi:Flp pilus assembly protein TadG